jgi:DHA2 family multidrug resistance protein
MTGPDANTQDSRPAVTTHSLLEVVGVLLGALLAFTPHSTGLTAMGRAAEVLGLQVRRQAPLRWQSQTAFFSWLHAAWRASWWFPLCPKVPTQYRHVTAAPVEVK